MISLEIKAQDYHFSQFYIAPLTLNPALTGLKNTDLRATANYRRQWSSISEPFQTVAIAADYNILNGHIGDNLMGVGLLIFNDKAGSAGLSRTKVAMTGAYSQNIAVEGNYISIGFEAGVINQRINPDKLMFENQYDGEGLNSDIPHNEAFSSTSQWDYDLAIGLAWSYAPDAYTSVYLGGSLSHLNRPDLSFLDSGTDELERKITLYGGAEFRVNGYFSLVPRAVLLKQGSHREINFGGYAKLNLGEAQAEYPTFLSIGGMYRLKDAVIPMLRFDYGPVGVGLSYDFNVSSLTKASNAQGGLELALVYKGFGSVGSSGPISCPSF